MVYGYDDVRVKPSEIRFIQKGISCSFQKWPRRNINNAIEDIARGNLTPENFPTIKVVQKDGKYYSFDNRRLYVFRVCEYRGYIKDIPVEIRPICELLLGRFDTEDDGRTVFVRGDITHPHCKEEWLKKKDAAGNWNLPARNALVEECHESNNSKGNEYLPRSVTDCDTDTEDAIINGFLMKHFSDLRNASVPSTSDLSSNMTTTEKESISQDDEDSDSFPLPQRLKSRYQFDIDDAECQVSTGSRDLRLFQNRCDTGFYNNPGYVPHLKPRFVHDDQRSSDNPAGEGGEDSCISIGPLKQFEVVANERDGRSQTIIDIEEDDDDLNYQMRPSSSCPCAIM